METRQPDYELADLLALGSLLDEKPAALHGQSVAMWMASQLLRVRDRDGKDRPLSANPAQTAFEAGRGRNNIVLKARQMGMTTWVAGRLFLQTITRPGTMAVQVAHTQESAEAIFRIAQRFWDALPGNLRTGALRRSRANAGQMRFPELDSEFCVMSAGNDGVGRGMTIHSLHCSEVSRWPGDAAAVLAGLRAAVTPSGEMVLESTPNGAYGAFYEEWLAAEERGFRRHFVPWWMEPSYRAFPASDFRDDELALMGRWGLQPEQIGFRRELEDRYRGLRSQEFAEDPESCFRATGECCFELQAIDRIRATLSDPIETRRGGALEIWFPPVAGKEYIAGVDSAGGGSDGDYAVVQIIEKQTGLQCAEVKQRLGTLELAKAAASLGREYGGALLGVERNNHGAAVLAYLDSVEHYRGMYEQGGVAGWLTTAGNKPAMVSRLGAMLVEDGWVFRSRRLLGECRTFVTHSGGRMGAVAGAHDDCVMGMAVAQGVRSQLLSRG